MGHKAIKGHEKGTYKLKKGQKRDLKKPKMQKKSCYSKILITYPFFFLIDNFPGPFLLSNITFVALYSTFLP